MGCNVKDELLTAGRDMFKEIKESAKFKKAEGMLTGILDGSITLEDLQNQQKANGKKRLVTRTARGKDTDTVPIYEHVEVEQVQAKKSGTNFFFRLSPNQWESTIEDEVEVVITKKTYKEIKVTYKMEDTSVKKDMQTEITDLQKLGDLAAKGGRDALKIFEEKAAEIGEVFDDAYNGIHTLLEKVRTDANIPIPPSNAVVIVDKEKRHSASNVINLEDPISITRVRARKANTTFFFNVTQYKFLKESASIITTNSYAEYIVNYRGKGSKTKNNDPAKLPSKDSIISDLNEGLSSLNENIGNVTQAIGEAAGQFGKDLSGLVASASSGSLIQDALAKAQNQPATYTVEKNVRDKNTNAINLPSLSGGNKGILEVQTRREDQQFFTNMFEGNVAGWRLDGEDLYLFEPRAEVKVKYTKEIDPPANAGIPAMSNDPDIPKLNPCKDIAAIKVKIIKKIKKDPGTGEEIEEVIKNVVPAAITGATPVGKSEPATTLPETSATIDATKSPTSNARQDDSVNLLDFYTKRAELVTKERKFSTNYLFEKNEMFAPKFNKIAGSQEVKSVKFKKKLADKKAGKRLGSTLEWYLTYPDEITTEERKVYNNMLVLFASIQSFDAWSTHYKSLVRASRMLTTEQIDQDSFDLMYNVFLNFEGVIMSDDPGINSDLGPDGLILPITSELDIAVFSNIPVLHEQNKDLLIAMEKYRNEN